MNENIEQQSINQEKDKLIKFFTNKKIIVFVGLLLILMLAWQVRTANVPLLIDITTNESTLSVDLDPFLFLRYSKIIIEEGSLPEIDTMRYYPQGYPTARETRVLPYMMSYNYHIMNIFGDYSINYAAVMFPVFMFLLTCIACFLFVQKIFEDKKNKHYIALIATALLAVAPVLLSRTIAGIPEKESAGFLFMFLSMYFFICSWKKDTLTKSLIFATLAGLSTAIMMLIWGGAIYLFVSISVFVLISFILGKINKQRFYAYTVWFFLSIIIPLISGEQYKLSQLLTSTTTGLSFIIFGLLLVDFILFKTNIKHIKILHQTKIPKKIISAGVFMILSLILSVIFLGPYFVLDFGKDIVTKLTEPITTRHASTVAENKAAYFNNWRDSFGPVVSGIPIFFWMFFAGAICLFYEALKYIDLKKKWILTTSFTIFLFTLIFSRYAANSQFNGVNIISQLLLFGGFALLLYIVGYILYQSYKEGKLDDLKKINSNYLFLIVLFIISLIGARAAIRLIMVLAIPAVALAAYLIVFVIEKTKNKDKMVFYASAGAIILLGMFVFYSNYQSTYQAAESFGPSAYTQQWQKAMSWVRTETPQDAVFASWWDYGYWVQSIGERATVLDGSNSRGVWNYYMGRHVLTGETEREALEFLYAHNVTHFLIDSTDIGKYPAYANIGSDENMDRYSWIGTFTIDNIQTQEMHNSISYTYRGGVNLDEDYIIQDSAGNDMLLPAGKSVVGALGLEIDNNGTYKQPIGAFVYNDKQINIPLRYLYINHELIDFRTGYEGTMYIFPGVTEQGINPINNAFFLSERNLRALWVRLYLLEEGEYFELTHVEQSLIVEDIKRQVFDFDYDAIYYGGYKGSIKIWKVNYPDDIEFKQEYLELDYSDKVKNI